MSAATESRETEGTKELSNGNVARSTLTARSLGNTTTGGANTATGRDFTATGLSSIDVQNAAQQTSEMARNAVSYTVYGVLLYVSIIVNIFHVSYFTFRKPAISKDLIKTAYHLLRVSYDNSLLSLREIYDVTTNTILNPMARQNRQHYIDEGARTSQLRTMRTNSNKSQS